MAKSERETSASDRKAEYFDIKSDRLRAFAGRYIAYAPREDRPRLLDWFLAATVFANSRDYPRAFQKNLGQLVRMIAEARKRAVAAGIEVPGPDEIPGETPPPGIFEQPQAQLGLLHRDPLRSSMDSQGEREHFLRAFDDLLRAFNSDEVLLGGLGLTSVCVQLGYLPMAVLEACKADQSFAGAVEARIDAVARLVGDKCVGGAILHGDVRTLCTLTEILEPEGFKARGRRLDGEEHKKVSRARIADQNKAENGVIEGAAISTEVGESSDARLEAQIRDLDLRMSSGTNGDKALAVSQ